jgi:hypothetical protein
MQKKKILFILALICVVVQGAWAQEDDNWENVSKTRPPLYSNYRGITNVFVVSTPQHLAWISENIDKTLYFTNGDYDGHTITFNIKKGDNWENMALIATGGAAGSNGTGGNRGLTASQHPGSNV